MKVMTLLKTFQFDITLNLQESLKKYKELPTTITQINNC